MEVIFGVLVVIFVWVIYDTEKLGVKQRAAETAARDNLSAELLAQKEKFAADREALKQLRRELGTYDLYYNNEREEDHPSVVCRHDR